MNKIVVNDSNSLDVVKRIVDLLRGKTFSIVSIYLQGGQMKEDPKVINPLTLGQSELPDGFSAKGGVVRIPLQPRRSIMWDLSEGEVVVDFESETSFYIHRQLPHEKSIYRVVVY